MDTSWFLETWQCEERERKRKWGGLTWTLIQLGVHCWDIGYIVSAISLFLWSMNDVRNYKLMSTVNRMRLAGSVVTPYYG